MATYRLDSVAHRRSPAPVPVTQRLPWRRAAVAAAGVALLVAAGAAVRSHVGSPVRVGDRFLAAYSAGDAGALYPLMDESLRRLLDRRKGEDLLRALHRPLPVAARVAASGRPTYHGRVVDWRAHVLRLEFEPPPESATGGAALIRLVRGRAGAWEVGFLQTYHSLELALGPIRNRPPLIAALRERLGDRVAGLRGHAEVTGR